MTWGVQLVARLAAVPDVTALLGVEPTMRVFAVRAPVGVAAPYMVYQLITETPDNVLNGPAIGARLGVQFDLYARSYAGLHALQKAFKIAFSGWVPSAGPVLSTAIEASQDGIEDLTDLYRRIIDLAVEIEE